MKVITSHDCPPIPLRGFDWSAVIDGQQEDGPYGRGPTQGAALVALAQEHMDNVTDEALASLEAVMLLDVAEAEAAGADRGFIRGLRHALGTAMGIV